MAKIGNEAKLILKLARERMDTKLKEWEASRSNPNSNSSIPDWMDGYKYCLVDYNGVLLTVTEELEAR